MGVPSSKVLPSQRLLSTANCTVVLPNTAHGDLELAFVLVVEVGVYYIGTHGKGTYRGLVGKVNRLVVEVGKILLSILARGSGKEGS